jgi:hypothetical protein
MNPPAALTRRHRELEEWFDRLVYEHNRLRSAAGSAGDRSVHIDQLRKVQAALQEHKQSLMRRRDDASRRLRGLQERPNRAELPGRGEEVLDPERQ